MVLTFVAACWALLGTGAITSLAFWTSRGGAGKAELDGAWQRYAWNKKYGFYPRTGEWPHAASPRVEGRVGDVDLVIDVCTMTVRGTPRACTRVSARVQAPMPARIIVSSDPRLMPGAAAHALEALRMGDAFFDHAFSVRASSGEAASRWLPLAVRRDLQALLSTGYRVGVVLRVDGGHISLTWLGEETRSAMLDEACALVACTCAAAIGPAAYR
ncbi:MAG: hypothetical protein ABSC94_13890 [Polyangiaceae bacterium]